MSSNLNVLVTGASRGIGKGLVAAYLSSPNITVVAAVRKAASAAESLQILPRASGSRLIVIEVDVASADTIIRGIASLEIEHNINSLNIVLANADIAAFSPNLIDASVSDIQPFLDVNAYGQLELFKTVAPLLRSLKTMNIIAPLSAYGASKALGNFLFKWLSLEQQDIIVWSQHPGIVAAGMAQMAIDSLEAQGVDVGCGFAAQSVSVEQSCQDILRVVDNATIENTHGRFLGPDGAELPWQSGVAVKKQPALGSTYVAGKDAAKTSLRLKGAGKTTTA